VTANVALDFDGLVFQYEPQHYIDQAACEKAFNEGLDRVPKLEKLIAIFRTLPEPPWGPRISDVFDAVDQIRTEVAR